MLDVGELRGGLEEDLAQEASAELGNAPYQVSDLSDPAVPAQLIGESIKELGRAIRKAVKPVNNTYFPPAYRRKMLPVLVKRAFAGLNSEAEVL